MYSMLQLNSTLQLLSGQSIPLLGLGTWQLMDQVSETVQTALELGYRLIDTSGNYGTQPGIGDALRHSPVERQSLFITTKIEIQDNAYEAAKSYVAEMGLTYANLILIHWPPMVGSGLPLWQGLIKAKHEGITRDIGVSNYSINLMEELIEATGEVPAVNQIEWSPFGYSPEMMTYCQSRHILLQAYSPLTRGHRLNNPILNQLASKYRKSPAQILIRWNLQLGVIPIIKASHRQHLEENIHIFDFELNSEEMNVLNNLNEEYSAMGSLPYL